jgi:CsoR family transcriptional regulator, copper-sensing transcriptional repressor
MADTLTGYGCDGKERVMKRGYSDDKEAVLQRLRRIEGQIRGLQRMVDEDAYCIDVLTQVSAATRALQSVSLELLGDHLAHCVRDAVAEGGPEGDAKIEEAQKAIDRLVRS